MFGEYVIDKKVQAKDVVVYLEYNIKRGRYKLNIGMIDSTFDSLCWVIGGLPVEKNMVLYPIKLDYYRKVLSERIQKLAVY